MGFVELFPFSSTINNMFPYRFGRVNLKNINLLLSELLTSKNDSLSNPSQRILKVLEQFFKVSYITILNYDSDQGMNVIASNVEEHFLPSLKNYCNTMFHKPDCTPILLTSKRRACVHYETAMDRNIHFSFFTPLMLEDKKTGAILLENKSVLSKGYIQKTLNHQLFTTLAAVLENIIYTQKLVEVALTDPLTEIHNRRYLNITLEKEFHNHRNQHLLFSVALVDIDHFKKINDTFGHPFGDLVLKEVATFIKSSIGKNSWVARYGGEEFLIFFGHSNPDGVYSQVETLCKNLENLPITRLTASFGVTTISEEDETTVDLIRRADEALYLSKKTGKNKVTVG